MRNKVIVTALSTLLVVSNAGIATYSYMNIEDKKEEIKDYKKDIDSKKIVIKNQGEIIEENKKVIADKDSIIIKDKELIGSQAKEINSLNGQVNSLKSSLRSKDQTINSLKSEVNKKKDSPTAVNYTPTSSSLSVGNYDSTFTVTAYTNHPSENGGTYGGRVLTKSGYDITNTIRYKGYGIIATDPNKIPLGTIVEIEGLSGKYISLDTGGAIKSNKIDLLVGSDSEARNWGVRSVGVKKVGFMNVMN